jgi:hypothetical protein
MNVSPTANDRSLEMTRVDISTNSIQSAIRVFCNGRVRTHLIAVVVVAATLSASAQGGNRTGEELQQRLAAIKRSTAENQQRLHKYQWVETTQLALKGDVKPASQSMCFYSPEGKVQKTPMGSPAQTPGGGRFKQRIIAKKKEEMKDYMGGVKKVLAMYVPPDPQRMQQAFQSGNVSLTPAGGTGLAQIVFKNYAQPGDEMTIAFNTVAKKISSLNVKTWMDDPKDAVTLAVQFASLPDGTNYVQQSVLGATAKHLQVTTTNSDYHLMGAH